MKDILTNKSTKSSQKLKPKGKTNCQLRYAMLKLVRGVNEPSWTRVEPGIIILKLNSHNFRVFKLGSSS